MFDLIIRGGAVYDGTGRPARWADVAVSGGKIAAVEPLPQARAARVMQGAVLYFGAAYARFLELPMWITWGLVGFCLAWGLLEWGLTLWYRHRM